MKTTPQDQSKNLTLAETYYACLLKEDFEGMEKCLHPEVKFIGPLAEMSGPEGIIDGAKKLKQLLGDITIRSKFSDENQIMLAYDFMFPGSIGILRAAVLMDFKDHLISRIELFYDARPFEKKKEQIFSGK